MQVNDLHLSTHTDIDILHRIFKQSQIPTLSFASIQLSLKAALKRNLIPSLDKYLHFFMLLKGECHDDSALAWSHHFHIQIRKLEREVLACVMYKRTLMGKALTALRSQLKMKIMETYQVSRESAPSEVVDYAVKMKARVFHCWTMLIQAKVHKKMEKEESEEQLREIAQGYSRSRAAYYMRLWKGSEETRKDINRKTTETMERVCLGRVSQTLSYLKEKKELGEMEKAVQGKISNALERLRKREFLTRLGRNMDSIVRPQPLQSYFSLVFMKELLERTFNQGRLVDFKKLKDLLPLKSSIRQEIFAKQMEVFFREVKRRAFKGWKSLICARNTKINWVKIMLLKEEYKGFVGECKLARNISKRVNVLKRITAKRGLRILLCNIDRCRARKQESRVLSDLVNQKISIILNSSNLKRLQQQVTNSKQHNQSKKIVHSFRREILLKLFFRYFARKLNVASVNSNIPLILNKRSLALSFKAWHQFVECRRDSIRELEQRQEERSSRILLAGLRRLKDQVTTNQSHRGNQSALEKSIYHRRLVNCVVGLKQFSPCFAGQEVEDRLSYRISGMRLMSGLKRRHQQFWIQSISHLTKAEAGLKLRAFGALSLNRTSACDKINLLKEGLDKMRVTQAMSALSVASEWAARSDNVAAFRSTKGAETFLQNIAFLVREKKSVGDKSVSLHSYLIQGQIQRAFSLLQQSTLQRESLRHKASSTVTHLCEVRMGILGENTIECKRRKVVKKALQDQLKQNIDSNRLRLFKYRSQEYLDDCRGNNQLLEKAEVVAQNRLAGCWLSFTNIVQFNLKANAATEDVQKKRKQRSKFLFAGMAEEVRLVKQMDKTLQPFSIQRLGRLKRNTLQSLTFEIRKRRKALDSLFNVCRAKQLHTLKFSLETIFDEYRVSFKSQACLRLRRRQGMQRLLKRHLEISNQKLQQYRCVKHYVRTVQDDLTQLLKKSMRGLVTVVTPSGGGWSSQILKTVPKLQLLR